HTAAAAPGERALALAATRSEPARPRRNERAMGNRKRAALVGFKGDLLRQHDIARDEVAIRNEAPFANVVARAVEFLDVRLRAMMYPIARPGVAARDVEISESLVAGALLRREPALQQRQRSRLGFEAERPAAGTRSRHHQRKR